jgi:hypothetical protein
MKVVWRRVGATNIEFGIIFVIEIVLKTKFNLVTNSKLGQWHMLY